MYVYLCNSQIMQVIINDRMVETWGGGKKCGNFVSWHKISDFPIISFPWLIADTESSYSAEGSVLKKRIIVKINSTL